MLSTIGAGPIETTLAEVCREAGDSQFDETSVLPTRPVSAGGLSRLSNMTSRSKLFWFRSWPTAPAYRGSRPPQGQRSRDHHHCCIYRAGSRRRAAPTGRTHLEARCGSTPPIQQHLDRSLWMPSITAEKRQRF